MSRGLLVKLKRFDVFTLKLAARVAEQRITTYCVVIAGWVTSADRQLTHHQPLQ